jgi:hypothetical protein
MDSVLFRGCAIYLNFLAIQFDSEPSYELRTRLFRQWYTAAGGTKAATVQAFGLLPWEEARFHGWKKGSLPQIGELTDSVAW